MGPDWLHKLFAQVYTLSRRRPRPGRPWPKRFRPAVEALEDRLVPVSLLQFSAAHYGVNEGFSPAIITVTRIGDPTNTVSVAFATGGGTATVGADFTATSGTLFFAPGETSKQFSIAVQADTLVESTETVNLSLSNPGGAAVLGVPSTAVLTIADAVPAFPVEPRLFTSSTLTTPGLVGSYVNQSLRAYAPSDDWRVTQTISGTRIDPAINFLSSGWGSRASVGLTGGTDANWDNFSVQWDGFVQIPRDFTGLRTRSDDGSRMWIDINGDGVFNSSGPEYVSNGWGSGQTTALGPASTPLRAGVYRVRVQYEEGTGGNVMQLLPDPPEMVRIAYVIPSNRAPHGQAVANLQSILPRYQEWYRDQMERNGFGPKSFLFEILPDGVTPRVHVVFVSETDDYLRGDLWTRTISVAQAAGVPVWSTGQDWLLIPEAHLQNSDGSILGGVALGASLGSGSDPGTAVLGSVALRLLSPTSLADNRPYDGLTIPEIGPYPLRQSVSFPWFEGSTISSVSSSQAGAALHELSHGLGLGHDLRNDENFHGNLMGNGLRGFRNELYPDLYPTDETRLGYGDALVLGVSRYFNPDVHITDEVKPTLAITTTGTVVPVNGLLRIDFAASDPGSLTAAVLRINGDTVGELPLAGAAVSASFLTPYYDPGMAASYTISVYDAQGNRRDASTTITPTPGFNRAPRPSFKLLPSTARAGAPVVLDASASTDPDHASSSLIVEWDINGDGVFDISPTTSRTLTATFPTVGTRLIRVRLTDPAGAQTISTPIALRVLQRETPPTISDIPDQSTSENVQISTIPFIYQTIHCERNWLADDKPDYCVAEVDHIGRVVEEITRWQEADRLGHSAPEVLPLRQIMGVGEGRSQFCKSGLDIFDQFVLRALDDIFEILVRNQSLQNLAREVDLWGETVPGTDTR